MVKYIVIGTVCNNILLVSNQVHVYVAVDS